MLPALTAATKGEVQIPAELKGIVTSVSRLGYAPQAPAEYAEAGLLRRSGRPERSSASTSFAKRYNFPTTHQSTHLDGTGQTNRHRQFRRRFSHQRLTVFFKEIKVAMPTVTSVSVDHAGNHPTTADSDDGEVMLDIEVAGAVVPNPSSSHLLRPQLVDGDQGFMDAISAAIHDAERHPDVISISWGGPESKPISRASTRFMSCLSKPPRPASPSAIRLRRPRHGRRGRAGLGTAIHMDHPAVDDYVLGCGGAGGWGQDVVWNDQARLST